MNKYWFWHNPSLTYFTKVLMSMSNSNRCSISESFFNKYSSYHPFTTDLNYENMIYDISSSNQKIDLIYSVLSKTLPNKHLVEIQKIINLELSNLFDNIVYDPLLSSKIEKEPRIVINRLLAEFSDNKVLLNRISKSYITSKILNLPVKYSLKFLIIVLWISEMNNDEKWGHEGLYVAFQAIFGDDGIYKKKY